MRRSKEATKAYNREWQKRNRAYSTIRQRAWRKANPDKVAKHNAVKKIRGIFYTYGITYEQKEALFEKQNRRCALCSTDKFDKLGPVVDHCHISGKIRGLLCSRCNLLLSAFERGKVSVTQVAQYLGEQN